MRYNPFWKERGAASADRKVRSLTTYVARTPTGESAHARVVYEKSWWRELLGLPFLARSFVFVDGHWFEEKEGCKVIPLTESGHDLVRRAFPHL